MRVLGESMTPIACLISTSADHKGRMLDTSSNDRGTPPVKGRLCIKYKKKLDHSVHIEKL